jgi:uncharacterized membrane protein
MSTPNPYAAPRAPVADAAAAPRNFIPTGRAVPAGHGWDWIAGAWDLFKRQPVMWIVFTVVGAVIFIAFHFLMPVVGQLVLTLLAPVFAGGIMIGCRDLEEGRELQFSHLFAGFRERFGSLISVGLISLAFTFVIALVVGLVTGAGMWTLLGGGADPAAVAAAGLTILLAFLVMLALLLPVYMAMWFAPPLVVFHAQGPGEAMKNSFVGCLKNIVPFLLYGVILFLLSIVATLPMLLGWLVLVPVVAGSLYTGYRDIFFD